MTWFFANPWGLLALLGVPAVLAIHLLRRRSRQIVVSTLFLVEDFRKSREGGRRIRMPRSSLPLLIQFLAVVLLALCLAGPRWVDPSSTVRAVIVLDRSASMGAFREEVFAALDQVIQRIASAAGTVEWTVIGSDATRLARGTSGPELLKSVEASWHPVLGTHDPAGALRLARTLAGADGIITFLSDHLPSDHPSFEDIDWVACGKPTANAALLSASANGPNWTALVANFSNQSASIPWRVDEDPWTILQVDAGKIAELSGVFPADRRKVLLELGEDVLALDNQMPILVPSKKRLAVRFPSDGPRLIERILRIAQPVTQPEEGVPADLEVAVYDPLSPSLPAGPALVFVKEPARRTHPLPGETIAENHPLMEDLNWQGFLAADSLGIPFREGDMPLLWVGQRPAIFLRPCPGGQQLLFNFDLESSNAAQLPAFALLLHRFLETRRREIPGFFSDHVTTGETLTLAGAGLVVAPETPGFFQVRAEDGSVGFEGAAIFSDPRESDLRLAASGASRSTQTSTVRASNALGQSLDRFLGLALAGLLIWNWWLTGKSFS